MKMVNINIQIHISIQRKFPDRSIRGNACITSAKIIEVINTGVENFLDVSDIVKDLKLKIINVCQGICESCYVEKNETKKEIIIKR